MIVRFGGNSASRMERGSRRGAHMTSSVHVEYSRTEAARRTRWVLRCDVSDNTPKS